MGKHDDQPHSLKRMSMSLALATADLPAAGSSPDDAGAERRVHKRHAAADIPFVTRVRLKYGPVVTLIDVSAGGAQIETTSFRMQPGSSVVLELAGDDREISVQATVLRCQLERLLPEPVYRGALAFKKELDLSALGTVVTPEPEPAAELDLRGEEARLRQVLGKLASALGARGLSANGTAPDPTHALFGALDAAMAVLDTPAGRRSGPALGSELACLLKATTDALNGHTKPASLIAAVEEHLRRVIPARAVRLDETGSFIQLPGSEAIIFQVPPLDPTTPPGKIVVEFAEDSEPLEWHMQLLKASLHLIALVRELGRRGGDGPLIAAPAQRLPTGWSRVVARYTSGPMIKGFTQHFLAANAALIVSPEPEAPANRRITVPFKDLKAIFFVRDHEGDAAYQERKTLDASARGRKVSVTFTDGEELVGTTVNYLRSAPGFFLHPADPKSNNERVFVIAQAVREVKFI